jgi:Na+-driven multidrug efflux pump
MKDKIVDFIKNKGYIFIALICLVALVVAGAETLFLTPLLKMFTHDLPTILMAKERFFAIVPWYFICGYMEISVGCMRGLNFYTVPMIVTVLGVCGLRILWVSTIYAFMPSIMTLYVSYPVSWATTALVQTILFFAILKKRKRLLL